MKTIKKVMCFVLLFVVALTLVGCARNKSNVPQTITDISQLAGRDIGVRTGSALEAMTDEFIDNAQKKYYESFADMTVAVTQGKISAFLADEPLARVLCGEQSGVHFLDDYLNRESYSFVFPKTENGATLRDNMNEFLAEIHTDGTLKEIENKWLGADESVKTVSYPDSTGASGTLRFITDSGAAPFAYIKDGEIVGYDIDILCRFCKKYGYGLELSDVDFPAIIPALVSGKADLASGYISMTEERAQSVYFSDADYEGGVVVIVADGSAQENAPQTITDISQLAGRSIGVVAGSTFDDMTDEYIENADKQYYESYADLAIALSKGKISGFLVDEPVGRMLCSEQKGLWFLDEYISRESYAFAFSKTDEGGALRDRFNEFLAEITSDGTVDELKAKWLGDDESIKTVTYPPENGSAGTLRFATCSRIAPFSYVKDGQVVGYDIDMLCMFCEKYGYSFELMDVDTSAIIPALVSGKADLAAKCITVTEERKESVYFSDANYEGGVVVMVSDGNVPLEESGITDISQLNGHRIGVITGSILDTMTDEFIENARKEYFETYTDLIIALKQGKVSAYLTDEPIARVQCAEQKGIRYLEEYISHDDYAFAFSKTERGGALRDSFNEYLSEIRADGTLKEIEDIWFGNDETAKNVVYPTSSGRSGTLRFITTSDVAPFSYVKDEKIVGYDIDVLCRFCEKYGYGLEISDVAMAAIIPALVTEKADLAACCITVTEERAQSVYFSDADYVGGVVVVVADGSAAAEDLGFFESLKESFYKNFVKENRWKMLLSGLGITVLISICSGVLGAVLGFGICMLRRSQNKIPRGIAAVYIRIMQGTPILVFLMILYYVIFGKTEISPIIVAVIGFGINFSAYVSEMMRTGIEAVDKGQTEAALALGYTKRQSFFKVVFPQAAKHFLPVIKGEFISLVKMTSIVGYITIQDLTKASDIIRSRTYEAFFPLIVTAIIYFVISWLLTVALSRIEIRLDPKKRSKNRKIRAKEVRL